MFRRAKVGDKVWSLTRGWGTIIIVEDHGQSSDYPIHVRFDKGCTNCYTVCGKFYTHDINPTLFWDEIKLEIPKKPLPELEVDTKVLVWNNGDTKFRRHFHSFIEDGRIRTWINTASSFTADNDDCYTLWNNWELYEDEQ